MALETKDILSAAAILVSTGIAVIGWTKAAQKDRNHHLFQKRLEKRLSMLDEVIVAVTPLLNFPEPFKTDSELPAKLSKARLAVQLYGYRDEVLQYESLITALEHGDLESTQKALSTLVPNIRQTVRREMGFASEPTAGDASSQK